MSKNIIYVCCNCGNKDIETTAWVSLNTNKYVSDLDDGRYWCIRCEHDCKPMLQDEYKRRKKNNTLI